MPTINLNRWDILNTVCTNDLYNKSTGGYCAQGRVFASARLSMLNGYNLLRPYFDLGRVLCMDLGLKTDQDVNEFMAARSHEIQGKPGAWTMKFHYAATLNNRGEFEAAHQLALEAAIESGLFKIIRRKINVKATNKQLIKV